MIQSCSLAKSRDMLSLLRTETRQQHSALEQHPLLCRLLSPGLCREEYGRLLQAFWCFYRRLEPDLMAALPELERQAPFVAYGYQSRLPLLEADFYDLLLGKPTPIVASNATISHPSPGEALGILYVLEGASQGGRVIAHRLRKTLGLSGTHGAHYFNQHEHLCSWPVFCDWLRQYPWWQQRDAAIRGARQTFVGLADQLNLWQVYSSEPLKL